MSQLMAESIVSGSAVHSYDTESKSLEGVRLRSLVINRKEIPAL
jgi:hypothetical protein